MNELGNVRQPIIFEQETTPTTEMPLIPIILPSSIPVSTQVVNPSMDVPGYVPVDQTGGGSTSPGTITNDDRGGGVITYGGVGVEAPIVPVKPVILPVIKPTNEQPEQIEAEKGFFDQSIEIFGFEVSYLQLTIGGGVGLLILILLVRK